jgi:hypothetical protein
MIFLILALLMLMAWAARSQPSEGGGGDIAAKVNGVPITTLELNRSFQVHVQVPYAQVQEDPRARRCDTRSWTVSSIVNYSCNKQSL